jgi:long-chain acyl-CoA synthetase
MEYFSPETRNRIKQYPLVWPARVNEKSDPLGDVSIPEAKNREPQAVPLPGTQQPGYSPIYRMSAYKDQLLSTYHPKVTTMYESFELIAKERPDQPSLGDREYDYVNKKWGPYKYMTYSQVRETKNDFAAGLVSVVDKHSGLSPSTQYVPATYAPNCSNWIITDLACISQGLPSVCLYDTLGAESSEYILNLVESPVVVASLNNIPKIFQLKPKLPHLKVVICISDIEQGGPGTPGVATKKDILANWANDIGLALYEFSEVISIGKQRPLAPRPPKPDDIYAFNFTSGTTGNPKGAILNHSAVVSSLIFTKTNFAQVPDIHMFSLLPLAHIYERLSVLTGISSGYKLSFPHGALTEIFEDIMECKPTHIDMVPRIISRITSALRASTIEAPGLAGAISRRAYAAKLAKLRATGDPSHPLWDRLWSKKIRAKLGFENLYTMTSGSAPLAKEDIEFLRCALSSGLRQGYGLTESLSGICANQMYDPVSGGCGAIGPTVEARLRDVPELNYSSSDSPNPRGELQLRGPQMFSGYYKEDKKTQEAIDKDGWFCTGDIGMFDKEGRLYIIGRVKNFFKLAQGEYIAPEKIEGIYTTACTMLSQIFVHGDSYQTYLVGVVGLDPVMYSAFVSKVLGQRYAADDLAKLQTTFDHPKVRLAVVKYMNKIVPKKSLQGFEKIKNLRLFFEPLKIENNTITPTLKVRRAQCEEFFQAEIKEMYEEGPLEQSSKSGSQQLAKL